MTRSEPLQTPYAGRGLALALLFVACSDATVGLDGGASADVSSSAPDGSVPSPTDATLTPDAITPDATLTPDAQLADDAEPGLDATPDAGVRGGPVCSVDGWCWSLRVPQGLTLRGVWSSGRAHAIAVGLDGVILSWDGADWTSNANPSSADLNAVWGSSATDVWAIGDRGTILHHDGVAWSGVPSGVTDPLRAIWASGPRDVWLVGGDLDPLVLRWDGNGWTSLAFPRNLGGAGGRVHQLRSVWGTASNDVWVIASVEFDRSVLMHWDGVAWTMSRDLDGHQGPVPYALVGTASSAVFALGGFGSRGTGNILRYDGAAWSEDSVGDFLSVLSSGWASGPDDVWAVGANGAVVHFDGQTWTPRMAPSRAALTSVWGSAADDVWMVGTGGTILHYDGAQLIELSDGPDFSGSWPNALWTTPGGGDVWVGGAGVIVRGDGSEWVRSATVSEPVRSLWGASPTDLWAVAGPSYQGQASALRWTAGRWRDLLAVPFTTWNSLDGVWGSSPSAVWTVGREYELGEWWPFILRWDEGTWSRARGSDTAGADPGHLSATWGSGPNDVWAVGTAGRAGAPRALILHWDGNAWAPIDSSLPPERACGLHAIWGSSPQDVWAVGGDTYEDNAVVLHWNGGQWTEAGGTSMPVLYAVSGAAANRVITAGRGGLVWEWDGMTWSSRTTGSTATLRAVAVGSLGEVWVAGGRETDAVVMRRR